MRFKLNKDRLNEWASEHPALGAAAFVAVLALAHSVIFAIEYGL